MSLPKIGYPISSIKVPSTGKTIKIRPFTVKEEKVLLLASEDGDEKAIRDAVCDLLQNCIVSRGVKVEKLASFDLEYIYLKIRSVSVGSTVEFVVTCKDDGETNTTVTVNLEDVEVEFPKGHNKKIMLDDKVGCVMKYPGIDTFVNVSLLKKFEEDQVVDFIADSIDQIFAEDEVFDHSTTTKEEFNTFIENMTREQFEKFSEFFETSPKLTHTFEAKNPNTGVVDEYTIEGLSNFFG